MDSLPNELIDYIANYLPTLDRYRFSVTNKNIYQTIWKPIDLVELRDLVFYYYSINLYSCFYSYNLTGYIKLPYLFEKDNKLFSLGFKYENNYLYILINKLQSNIVLLSDLAQDLSNLGYQPIRIGNHNIELRKPYNYNLDQLDFFHQNVKTIMKKYNGYQNAKDYYINETYLRILQMIRSNQSEQQCILETFWKNSWEPSEYHYIDIQKNIEKNLEKQNQLTKLIKPIINNLDNPSLVKLANYLTDS